MPPSRNDGTVVKLLLSSPACPAVAGHPRRRSPGPAGERRSRSVAGRPAGHQALLDAASAEFAGRGYYATSIRDIAARAGVSLSALYHYYPSKQALLAALLHEGMDAYFALCDEALAEAGRDPAGRLAAVVGATVRYRAERSV